MGDEYEDWESPDGSDRSDYQSPQTEGRRGRRTENTYYEDFFKKNEYKARDYDYLVFEITYILRDHMFGIVGCESYTAEQLVELVKEYLEQLELQLEEAKYGGPHEPQERRYRQQDSYSSTGSFTDAEDYEDEGDDHEDEEDDYENEEIEVMRGDSSPPSSPPINLHSSNITSTDTSTEELSSQSEEPSRIHSGYFHDDLEEFLETRRLPSVTEAVDDYLIEHPSLGFSPSEYEGSAEGSSEDTAEDDSEGIPEEYYSDSASSTSAGGYEGPENLSEVFGQFDSSPHSSQGSQGGRSSSPQGNLGSRWGPSDFNAHLEGRGSPQRRWGADQLNAALDRYQSPQQQTSPQGGRSSSPEGNLGSRWGPSDFSAHLDGRGSPQRRWGAGQLNAALDRFQSPQQQTSRRGSPQSSQGGRTNAPQQQRGPARMASRIPRPIPGYQRRQQDMGRRWGQGDMSTALNSGNEPQQQRGPARNVQAQGGRSTSAQARRMGGSMAPQTQASRRGPTGNVQSRAGRRGAATSQASGRLSAPVRRGTTANNRGVGRGGAGGERPRWR